MFTYSQAFDTRNILTSQRSSLTNANANSNNITGSSNTINKLIDGISRKKYNENIIIVIFISILLCFTIWWIFLR